MDEPTKYELLTRVEASDIDQLGHVNNLVYLRWVQDVAIAHWRVLATAEEQAAVAWVVVRHEIDYRRPAFAGEAVALRTWVGQATSATFERHTEIVRQDDGVLLARARTLWAPIDPASGRLKRVDGALRARVSVSSSG